MKKAFATIALAGLLVVGNVSAAEAAKQPQTRAQTKASISRVGAFGLGCGPKMHEVIINGISYCVINTPR